MCAELGLCMYVCVLCDVRGVAESEMQALNHTKASNNSFPFLRHSFAQFFGSFSSIISWKKLSFLLRRPFLVHNLFHFVLSHCLNERSFRLYVHCSYIVTYV